ncbi:uncharacterized protein B0T15DRAFT_496102 [Chaetomium strumarium]|uniref:Uncharacterized protein n=1 Tax=Chaetomium strumarium TaxID=1170767 RepID=A0AAJ0GP85_9PEZI|nr:hypothetical protein B0T15DRAFT_496102 [Chaetomium strumarium]
MENRASNNSTAEQAAPSFAWLHSTEAATATVCRIAWNYDDTEGREFRAEVTFRSKDDVVNELEDVLDAVAEHKEIRDEEFEDEEERFRAIEEFTDIISRGIH